MHRPVRVTDPALLPISVEYLRGFGEHSPLGDFALEGLIRAAVDHLDGWTGILGCCLVEQEWRQDFDAFDRVMKLPLRPVLAITSVRYRNTAGQMATVPADSYSFVTDAGGMSSVRFRDQYSMPSSLNQSAAVSITFRAGFATVEADGNVPARSTVPDTVKVAIAMMVHHMKAIVEKDLFETQENVVGIGGSSRSVTPYVGDSVTKAVSMLLSGIRTRTV